MFVGPKKGKSQEMAKGKRKGKHSVHMKLISPTKCLSTMAPICHQEFTISHSVLPCLKIFLHLTKVELDMSDMNSRVKLLGTGNGTIESEDSSLSMELWI